MKCGFCGTEISDTSKFCMECGNAVIKTPDKCNSCGAKLEPASKFCSECGNAIVNAPPIKQKTDDKKINNADDWQYLMSKEYEDAVICSECGNACSPEAVVCTKCGSPLTITSKNTYVDDYPVTILKVVSFFVPLAGLILYLTHRPKRPRSAAEYGRNALSGLICGFCLLVVLPLLFIGILFLLSAFDGVLY